MTSTSSSSGNDSNVILDINTDETTSTTVSTMARMPSRSHQQQPPPQQQQQQQQQQQHYHASSNKELLDSTTSNSTTRHHGLFVWPANTIFVDGKENNRHANNSSSSSSYSIVAVNSDNNEDNNDNEEENRFLLLLDSKEGRTSTNSQSSSSSSSSLSDLANTTTATTGKNNNARIDDDDEYEPSNNCKEEKEEDAAVVPTDEKGETRPDIIREETKIQLHSHDDDDEVTGTNSDACAASSYHHTTLPKIITNPYSSSENDHIMNTHGSIQHNSSSSNIKHEKDHLEEDTQSYDHDFKNDHDDDHMSDDDYDDDDDCSEASGDTVVHNDCPLPPPNATQEEINRFYWEWCYGPIMGTTITTTTLGMQGACKESGGSIPCSAMRSAPAKSCLSTKKTKQGNDVNKPNFADSVTPRRILHHSTSPLHSNIENKDDGGANNQDASSSVFQRQTNHPKIREYTLTTPTDENDAMNNNDRPRSLSIHHPTPATQSEPESHLCQQHTSAVKFGINTAAEFDASQPITEMTPIPLSVVQQKFPSNAKEGKKAEEEHGHSRETARNVAMLAEWDDDFDRIVEDSDDDDDDDDGVMNNGSANMGGLSGSVGAFYRNRASDLPGGRTMKRGRKRTPYKKKNHGSQKSQRESGSGRRSISSSASSRRRESSLFSRERKSLIDPDDSMDMEDENGMGEDENNTLLPYSVYIAPDEYTSPSSTSISDSVSTLGTPGVLAPATVYDHAAQDIPSKSNIEGGDIRKPTDDNNTEGIKPSAREEMRRTSLDSACVSPSSLKSSVIEGKNSLFTSCAPHRTHPSGWEIGDDRSSIIFGRESNDSSSTITGRETPNSARTSSSTILRAVHSSGALLPGTSPRGGCGPGARRGGEGGDDSSFLMEEVKIASENGGRLRPNQLKYSPSNSSSSGSICCDGRMLSSPSDSESLNSDIITLFSQYNMGGTLDKRSKDHFFLLGKQLTILSEHPTHPFHTSISDLLQLSHSSSHNDKELMEFTSRNLLRGLTPSASLALIIDDLANNGSAINDKCDPKKVYYGKTWLLPSSLFRDQQNATNATSVVQESYESILLDEVKNVCSSDNSSTLLHLAHHQEWGCATSHTISSCIQHLYHFSYMDWSNLEVDVAERTLVRLQEWAESLESDNWISNECRRQLMKMTTFLSGSSNARLKLHHHRFQAQMSDEISKIALLEEQLVMEANLLEEMARIKRYLDAQLYMERCSPISALTEEIRALVLPSPIMANNGTDFSFSLLDGAAEIVLKLAVDDDHNNNDIEDSSLSTSFGDSNNIGAELGCFIKDGDGASIKLLQALLLGKILIGRRMNSNAVYGPHILRENLSHFITESHNSQVDLLHQLTYTTSRIDTLVRSVRDLEIEEDCVCRVMISSDNAEDVSLFISIPTEGGRAGGDEIQLHFSFINLLDKNWNITTPFFFPNDVKISFLSKDETAAKDEDNMVVTSLQRQMQEMAHHMLYSEGADPILLKRICRKIRQIISYR